MIQQFFSAKSLPNSSPHDSAQAEHGHIHGHEDDGHEQADQQDQQRFEQGAQSADQVFHLFHEGVALPPEHFGQSVGLLAHTDQRDEFAVVQGRELRQCSGERYPLLQIAADGVE